MLDNPNHEIYLRGSGTVSWCGNLMFGKRTSFEKLRSDEDLLISYSRYNMNKVLFKQRTDSKFVPELYEIVKVSQIFTNDTLELTETPVNNQIEGEFLYYTKAERNESIYEPIERNSYWSVECPDRISFNPVDSLSTYSGPCLDLESAGKGLIAFSVTYPVLNSTITPLEITLTSATSSHLTLLLGTSKGYGIKLQYKSEILYERVYSTKLLQDNLGNTSLYLAIYNSSILLGLGQKLGSLIKLRISDPLINSIISLSFSSLHPVSIYDICNLSIQPFMESVLDTIISIPAPNKAVTLIEEIDRGDSCGSREFRKTQVEYICGEDNSILEVDEYMPCRYRLVLGTPLLCPIKFDFLPPTRSMNFSMDKVIYMRRRRRYGIK